ncbi:MAG: o-succinylbenzoate synthase [Phycisphaerales bacterium]|nr:o-succinylbenzoate synthase [Phycisphaerales bacterium]
MKFDLAYFDLPFKKPYVVGSTSIPSRQGVMVRCTKGSRAGYGEVAPLAGFHRETLAEALACLQEAIRNHSTPIVRSAAFGMSCAIETAAANKRFGFGDPALATSVGINAFFSGGAREAKVAFTARDFDGFKTIKIKIGRGKPVDDLRTISTILGLIDAGVRIRLDGNRMMSLATAERLLSRLDASRIEYVEEPLQDHTDLSELSRRVGMVMAIDESLHLGVPIEEVLGAPGVEVQVVKPSLLGALEEVESVVTRGRIQGMDTVLSTTVDSSYTIALVARMATALGVGDRDHGLGTAALFAADVVEPARIIDGQMAIAATLPVPLLPFVPAERFTLPSAAASNG